MRLQLTWRDPNTQQVRSPTLETPIAFGREFGEMPSVMTGKSVRRMVLASEQVLPFHAILAEAKGKLAILDRQEGTGTYVNGTARPMQAVKNGDCITIGPFEITVAVLPAAEPVADSSTDKSADKRTSKSLDKSANKEVLVGLATDSAVGRGLPLSDVPPSHGPGFGKGFGADGLCDRQVGFLFKRRCGRPTTEGCPDCQNGQIEPGRDRYEDDYAFYPDYGHYGRGRWGHDYYHNRHHYHYNPHSRHVDFNESDAASFEQSGDQDYEMDLDAS